MSQAPPARARTGQHILQAVAALALLTLPVASCAATGANEATQAATPTNPTRTTKASPTVTADRLPPPPRGLAWTAGELVPAQAQRTAWATDDTLVFAATGTGKVTALAKSTGSVRWTYRMPAPSGSTASSGQVCWASGGLLEGAVAVSYRAANAGKVRPCRGLLLLDLDTGKKRWNVSLPSELALSKVDIANGLVVGSIERDGTAGDSLAGFDGKTGEQLWSRDTDCPIVELAGSADRIVVVNECDDEAFSHIRGFDSATGDEHAHLRRLGRTYLLSAEPLVLYDGRSVIVPSTDMRRFATAFRVGAVRGYSRYNRTAARPPGVVVAGNRIVVPVYEGDVTAWDLRTGEKLWERHRTDTEGLDIAGPVRYSTLVAVDDAEVVLAQQISDQPSFTPLPTIVLLRLDPSTGEATWLGKPLADESGRFVPNSWAFWDRRRFYFVNQFGDPTAFAIE